MRLSVFGVGYVGCVSAACFANDGHTVTGVDVNRTKVEILNRGDSPIVEPGISDLVRQTVNSGHLNATIDSATAVHNSDISLVCVGTPSKPNGSLDLRYVEHVCEAIGKAIGEKTDRHVVVIRSTMLPGTTDKLVIPTLERSSNKKAGQDFGVCVNPEFLREGSSLKDFYAPPFTLIGADDHETTALVKQLYANLSVPCFKHPSELLKWSNMFAIVFMR